MTASLKSIALALTLVASAVTARADDKEVKKSTGFGTGIYTTKQGKINVLIDKANADASTMLLLRTEKGETVYRETISKNQQKFGRVLNVDELEAGKYEIVVISKGESQSRSFELSAQKTERILAIK